MSRLIEKYTELILRNNPLAADAPDPVFGCVQTRPGRPNLNRMHGRCSTRSLLAWPDV